MCMRACMHTLNKKPPPSCKHKNQNSDRIPTPPTRPLHDNTCFFFCDSLWANSATDRTDVSTDTTLPPPPMPPAPPTPAKLFDPGGTPSASASPPSLRTR